MFLFFVRIGIRHKFYKFTTYCAICNVGFYKIGTTEQYVIAHKSRHVNPNIV